VLDHPWLRLVLGVLAAAALGALAARIAGVPPSSPDPAGAGAPGTRTGAGSGTGGGATGGGVRVSRGGGGITVHVTGAVRRPGVYELREGARVFEAVRKAGGATRRADRQGLNLAAALQDGQQVRVPARERPGTGGKASGDAAAGEGPIDLNAASATQLQELDGVGPTTAEKILRLREERGGIGSVDDLDEIPGIGPKKLEALRQQLGGG
jgi:competence protein ComEA